MRYLTALLTRSKKSSALRATNVLQFKRRRRRLFVEQLEDRRLLATFTVLNIADSGAGSLRQAIVDSNANLGNDIIQFGSGVNGTITLTSGELAITGAVDLQGPGTRGQRPRDQRQQFVESLLRKRKRNHQRSDD